MPFHHSQVTTATASSTTAAVSSTTARAHAIAASSTSPAAPPTAPHRHDRPQTRQERVLAAYVAAIPAVWREAIPARVEVVPGSTSLAWPHGLIEISHHHARLRDPMLRNVIGHEFGHLIAFRFGSQRFHGAAPEGWPGGGPHPAEAWADCVAQVFSGVTNPSYRLPACRGEPLAWAEGWLAGGPWA